MPLVSVALASRSRQAEPIHTNEFLPELRGGEGEMISLWASGAVSSFKSHGYLPTKTVTTIVSRNNNTAFKTLFYSINSSKCLLALFFSPELLHLEDIPRGKTEGLAHQRYFWRGWSPPLALSQCSLALLPAGQVMAAVPWESHQPTPDECHQGFLEGR